MEAVVKILLPFISRPKSYADILTKLASFAFYETYIITFLLDVNAIAKHISVNWDAVGTMYGQHAFALEPKGQY